MLSFYLGAFKSYSGEARADGTPLVQGWLKIPFGVNDDFDDDDEATVPEVKEFDATAFLATWPRPYQGPV